MDFKQTHDFLFSVAGTLSQSFWDDDKCGRYSHQPQGEDGWIRDTWQSEDKSKEILLLSRPNSRFELSVFDFNTHGGECIFEFIPTIDVDFVLGFSNIQIDDSHGTYPHKNDLNFLYSCYLQMTQTIIPRFLRKEQ